MSAASPADYEAQLLARFEGDAEGLREVAQVFLDESLQYLEAIRAAVAARDGPMIHRRAHTLKGSICNFLGVEHNSGDDPAQQAAAAAMALEQLGAIGQLESIDGAFAAVQATLDPLRGRLQALIAS
jgi:HPt (histidine-containing phosphotransfer) domain-containing protein